MPEIIQNVIREERVFEVLDSKQVISERNGNKIKRMRLTGIVQKCDEFNENKRRYGYSIMKEAIDAIQDNITKRRVLGELQHPESATINIDRVSHVMTKVWMDNKRVLGELEVLEEMPCGKILKTLVDSDITMGISSRGVGDLQPVMAEGLDEGYEVMPGYRFVTWDIVAEPSVTEAQLSVLESIQRKGRITKEMEAKFLEGLRNHLKG